MRADLQTAIIAKMQGDATLMSLVGSRLYDEPPGELSGGGPTYPYLTIGEPSARDNSTKTDVGIDADTQINVWSQAGGKLEALQILDAITSALSYQPLDVPDHCVSVVELTEVLKEDQVTWHGVARLRTTIL